MEADFFRFYHIDLRAAVWGAEPVGARRMVALIAGLPADAAYATRQTSRRQKVPDLIPAASRDDMRRFFRRR